MAKHTRTKRNFIGDMMAEHIHLAGCPGFIVTREWAYSFFVKLGLPAHNGGFNSADYLAFRRPSVDEPLTDLSEPWAQRVITAMEAM